MKKNKTVKNKATEAKPVEKPRLLTVVKVLVYIILGIAIVWINFVALMEVTSEFCFLFYCAELVVALGFIYHYASKKRKPGFIGIMAFFISILILTFTIAEPNLNLRIEYRNSAENGKAYLRGIQSAVELYYEHNKRFPNDLSVLLKEAYLSKDQDIDPWGSKCRYELNYSKSGKPYNYRLGSCGPDKKPDTKDDIDTPIEPNRHTFRKGVVEEFQDKWIPFTDPSK